MLPNLTVFLLFLLKTQISWKTEKSELSFDPHNEVTDYLPFPSSDIKYCRIFQWMTTKY